MEAFETFLSVPNRDLCNYSAISLAGIGCKYAIPPGA
jgi:hypothetical protein